MANRFFMPGVRLLHIHLSLLALAVLLLYAVSGLTLSHADALEGPSQPATQKVQIQPNLPANQAATAVRGAGKLRGHVESSESSGNELRLVFARPGYRAEAVIDQPTGKAELTIQNDGILGLLHDLHRGKHVQGPWSIVVDCAALALAMTAVTGLVLWFSLPARRRWGTVWLVLGAAGLVVLAAWSF